MATYAEQLASVQAAMAKIEAKGQRWEMATDGSQRMVERADYKALSDREDPAAARRSGGKGPHPKESFVVLECVHNLLVKGYHPAY